MNRTFSKYQNALDDNGMEVFPYLSIVVPAHNEEEGIVRAVEKIIAVLKETGVTEYEILVIDDGSKDATYSKIEKLNKELPQVKGIRFSRNFGKEAALLAGLRKASGQVIITIDADLQHPPNLIPEMLEKWRCGAMVVHAVKRDRSIDSVFVRLRANFFNTVCSKLGGVNIENSSDFKLLDRSVVNVLSKDLRERQRFYRGLTDWVGFQQDSVLFDVEPRITGTGKWSFISLLDLALTATVSFTSAPLRIVTFLGLITLGFAFVFTSETLWSRFHGRAVSGFATLEITMLLLGSFIMISLGIVGEYIAKIFEESKARPTFIIGKTCGWDHDND